MESQSENQSERSKNGLVRHCSALYQSSYTDTVLWSPLIMHVSMGIHPILASDRLATRNPIKFPIRTAYWCQVITISERRTGMKCILNLSALWGEETIPITEPWKVTPLRVDTKNRFVTSSGKENQLNERFIKIISHSDPNMHKEHTVIHSFLDDKKLLSILSYGFTGF